MRNNVIELTLHFKYEWKSLTKYHVNNIARIIGGGWIRRGKHTEHTVSVLTVTLEGPEQLMNRVRHGLQELGVVENAWAHRAMREVGSMLSPDAFASNLRDAWIEADKRNNAQYLREGRGRDGGIKDRVEQLDRGAPFEVGFRARGERKPSGQPDND
jgi:hypothetical protein